MGRKKFVFVNNPGIQKFFIHHENSLTKHKTLVEKNCSEVKFV